MFINLFNINNTYFLTMFIIFFSLGLALFLVIITVIIYYIHAIISSQRRKRYTGSKALINSIGTASKDIVKNGSGFITIDGVSWEVINKGDDDIKKYDKVIVTGRNGLKLIVKKMEVKNKQG